MQNEELNQPTVSGHKAQPTPKCEFPQSGVNTKVFAGMRNNKRIINRKGTSLMVEASLRCTALCNVFFKFLSNNSDIEAQKTELNRLNMLWKQWLHQRSDKYVYKESAPFFLEKIKFMIGDKEIIEAEIEKIKSSENLES